MVCIRRDDGFSMLNLTLGVGKGRANNRDDVALIQFMLNKWLQPPHMSTLRSRAGANGRALSVDGLIGPKTNYQIRLFQIHKSGNGNGVNLILDGAIDPFRPNTSRKESDFAYIQLWKDLAASNWGDCLEDMRYDPAFPKSLVGMAQTCVNESAAARNS